MKTEKLSVYETIKSYCEDTTIARNLYINFIENESACEDNFEILSEYDARERIQDNLENEPYILGCFNASFLSGFLNVGTGTIEKLQEIEAFEAIGELILGQDCIEELVDDYISGDGFGHALNSYDGTNEGFTYNGESYIIFRNQNKNLARF